MMERAKTSSTAHPTWLTVQDLVEPDPSTIDERSVFYGLCGPNCSGKSTLMCAINNEQVEGFPKNTEVKTVFVEHDLDSSDTVKAVVRWTFDKLAETGAGVSVEDFKTKLGEFGFLETRFDAPFTSLSGGWKMKLALARAVFENPNIILLDEHTNHGQTECQVARAILDQLTLFSNGLVHSGFDHRWWENQRLLSIRSGKMTRKQIR